MKLLAIDPGDVVSAYVVTDTNDPTMSPLWFDKLQNEELLALPHLYTCDRVAIEQIGHYGTGMPAGQTVFDTCVWIGRFLQAATDMHPRNSLRHQVVHLIPRREVKLHLCGSARANDGNIRQALIDRFAPDQPNSGKGRKNEPGFFYGFHSDVWQAMALAVYFMDTKLVKTA